MCVDVSICIWACLRCASPSSSVETQFRKEEEEMLFQGKPLSLENLDPSYKVRGVLGLWDRKDEAWSFI